MRGYRQSRTRDGEWAEGGGRHAACDPLARSRPPSHAATQPGRTDGLSPRVITWADWIDPLLDHPIFKGVEVLATEYAVYDKQKNCAGSFDFLLKVSPTSGEDNRIILGDLKTVSSKKALAARKPADAQLAAYQSMLASSQRTLLVTDLVTVVCGPGETRILNTDAESAWTHWEEAWGRYSVTLPSW